MQRRGERTTRRLLIATVVVLVALTLLRSGTFDFAQRRGMVRDPCAALRPGWSAVLRGEDERQRMRDWAGLCHFRKDNARLIAGQTRPDLVLIGDSVTEFWQRDRAGFFVPGRVSRGLAGQTSAQVLLRFEQDVVALRPRAVHILIGLNDVAGNTGPTDPAQYRANIRAMVAIARANGIAVVLGTLPPARGFYWREGIEPRPWIADLNRWLRTYAAEQSLPLADYHAVLATPDGLPRPEFDIDGVHPNLAAYAAMESVAEAAFAKIVQAAP